jgi:cytochrome c oxidase subunit 4
MWLHQTKLALEMCIQRLSGNHLITGVPMNTADLPSVCGNNMPHTDKEGQHSNKLYLVVWACLFVLSAGSLLVDWSGCQEYRRHSLIILFMLVKAGLIVFVFMGMARERLSLWVILVPAGVLLLFAKMMSFEADYTQLARVLFFGP